MNKKRVFVLVLLSMILILSGCSTSKGNDLNAAKSDSLKVKDQVIVAVGGEKESGYDPTTGWASQGVTLFQSKLLDVNAENELINDLAKDYFVSDDGLTWTFHIRDDVFFHDGEKLTAKDVAFTYNKTKEKGLSVIDLTRLDQATAVDDQTVVFKMISPMSTFIYATASLGIVPEHAYTDNYGQHPIGSGPYKFVQWDKGQQLIVERNEEYYGGVPPIKRIVLLFLSDDAAYAALQAGEVDVAKTSEELAVRGMSGYRLVNVKTSDFRSIALPVQLPGGTSGDGLPVGNAITSDIAIRKALATGINRQRIIDDVLNGYGEIAYTISENLPWAIDESLFKDGDTETAKLILDNAGWIDSDNDGIREKEGNKAEFTLIYAAGDSNRQSIALAFSEQAKEMGINVLTEGLASADREPRKHKDAFLLGGGSYNPDPLFRALYGPYAAKGGWNNIVGYKNEAVDKYLEAAISAKTEQEGYEYWQKAQWDGTTGGSILGDAPYIYIANISHLYFVKDGLNIGNQKVHPHDHGFALLGNIMEWSLGQ